MIPRPSEAASQLVDDLMAWYAEADHGKTLYITLPALEWRLRLTRQRCGVTWRPPGHFHDAPVWWLCAAFGDGVLWAEYASLN